MCHILPQALYTSLLPRFAGKAVYLTGHSQGGARAALVSMWREKKFGEILPTYTFAGTGLQCAVRYSLPSAYADDVDIARAHPQITQYVHALDPYGWIDHQAGRVCVYGVDDLRGTRGAGGTLRGGGFSPTRAFCERIIGYSGPQLLLPGSALASDFAACRYFTHWSSSLGYWSSVFHALVFVPSSPRTPSCPKQDAVLGEDGTTDVCTRPFYECTSVLVENPSNYPTE